MKLFIQILKEEEEKLLAAKTSWGRNDLKLILEQAKNSALIRYYEENSKGYAESKKTQQERKI